MTEPRQASPTSDDDIPLPRAESVLLVLAFSLPFCSVARLPPNPAFWGEWAGALLFAGWLATRLWRQPPGVAAGPRAVTWVALVFPAVAAVIVVQLMLRSVRSPIESMVVVAVLLLAGAVCAAANVLARAGERAAALRAAAWGLLAAFLANVAATLLAWSGYGLILFEVTRVAADPRAVGLVGQANQLGTLAVLALAAAAHLRSCGRLPRWAWAAVVVLAAVVCAATGSRIAVVEWLLAMALAWWHGRATAPPGEPERPMASARGLALPLLALLLAQVVWVRLVPLMANPTVTAARGGFESRLEMLRDGVLMWWLHPWLGVGQGNYAGVRLFELAGKMVHPEADHAHNLFVQALAEWGPLGLLAAAAAALLLLRAALRRGSWQGASGQVFAATVVLCLLAHSLVEHPLWFVNLLLPFAWFAGLLTTPTCFERGPAAPWSRPGAALVAAATVAVGALVAVDYGRSQSLAVRAAAQGIGAPDLVSANALEEISRIAVGTLFPTEVAIMQGRSFAFNADFADFKFATSERALRGVPSAETAARYVAFAALSGHAASGQSLLDSLASRSSVVHAQTLEILALFATTNPSLAAIVPQAAAAAASR